MKWQFLTNLRAKIQIFRFFQLKIHQFWHKNKNWPFFKLFKNLDLWTKNGSLTHCGIVSYSPHVLKALLTQWVATNIYRTDHFRVWRWFKYMQIMVLLQKKRGAQNHLETNIKQQIANITLAKWKNFIALSGNWKCGIA